MWPRSGSPQTIADRAFHPSLTLNICTGAIAGQESNKTGYLATQIIPDGIHRQTDKQTDSQRKRFGTQQHAIVLLLQKERAQATRVRRERKENCPNYRKQRETQQMRLWTQGKACDRNRNGKMNQS